MTIKSTITSILAVGLCSAGLNAAPDFKKDVMPILQESCIDCHAAPYKKGTRLRKPKGGYRVDTRENILKAGESEEAGVIPGNAAKSQLYKRIILEEDHDDIMPPKGDPLTPAQQKVIKDWIDAGAAWAPGVVLQRKG
ncbi:MAG: hypothetical protein HN494_03315 [Opitutae bacterium]|jgi:hypothetical protein|nr:hypothetical protein [Opitutae bacterium]MBT6851909.1 hypothetical protein [Opitutae bacterium]MBT7743169.1 hypothetical protein [Opitutae bacterium]MBT7923246.1 hypothetical protein [Opitutae bacterium]